MTDLKDIFLRVHSYESGGTVDGPGIRFVVFLQGCPLRCQYCHNPDTWNLRGGKLISAQDVVDEVLKYENFMTFSHGGVTFSGGEPLVQKQNLVPVFAELKKHNIHIALDTAGTTNIDETTLNLLDKTDLVMLDVKHILSAEHKVLTGMGNEKTYAFLEVLKQKNIRTWIRWVIVPNFNDSIEYATKFAELIKNYPNVELAELLPYHQHGVYKWKELGLDYPLKDTPEPEKETVKALAKVLEDFGVKTLYAK
ncbi:MAG: pyruvate formate lyase-activating protein [Alphaproteobacteria bacterium]|nr:pyruvate formate lyase-activating protein [Alphaproteobacteria bacterium]